MVGAPDQKMSSSSSGLRSAAAADLKPFDDHAVYFLSTDKPLYSSTRTDVSRRYREEFVAEL